MASFAARKIHTILEAVNRLDDRQGTVNREFLRLVAEYRAEGYVGDVAAAKAFRDIFPLYPLETAA